MGRIIAIDYGKKRTGLAVTDPLKIIASPLKTVATDGLMEFLKQYCTAEDVEQFVLGDPSPEEGEETNNSEAVATFYKQLQKAFPSIPVDLEDERFTSVMARRALVEGGFKKKERQKKERTDELSAVFILRSFMERNSEY